MRFKNPKNGYVEEKYLAWLGAFLFGGLYFIGSGLWAQAVIWILIALVSYSLMGAPVSLYFMVVVNVIYAFLSEGLVREAYLRKGWEDITYLSKSDSEIETEDKKCPFCAETIKAEAIKCRYCGSDLTPHVTRKLRGSS